MYFIKTIILVMAKQELKICRPATYVMENLELQAHKICLPHCTRTHVNRRTYGPHLTNPLPCSVVTPDLLVFEEDGVPMCICCLRLHKPSIILGFSYLTEREQMRCTSNHRLQVHRSNNLYTRPKLATFKSKCTFELQMRVVVIQIQTPPHMSGSILGNSNSLFPFQLEVNTDLVEYLMRV